MGVQVAIKGRFSYLNVSEPKAKSKDKPNDLYYSTALIVPKDSESAKVMLKAEKEAFVEKFGEKKLKNGKVPSDYKWVKDGDEMKDDERKYGEECKDCYVINASCKAAHRPALVAGRDKHPITADEVKSGDYGAIHVTVYGYEVDSSIKGVTAQFNHLLKIKTGEALGIKPIAVDDAFGDLPTDDIEFDSEEDTDY